MGAERETKRGEQMQAAEAEKKKYWDESVAYGLEKYPTYFKPDETDPEGNKLLDAGRHLADRILNDGKPLKEGDKQWSPQQLTDAQAAAYNQIMAFPRMAYRLKNALAENAKLKKDLSAYESSEPGKGDGDERDPSAIPVGDSQDAGGAFDSKFK
jgi:hypothetical protein